MLSLESHRWAELRHAYGSAKNLPPLLRQLDSLPASKGNAEPWFTLWSALAHQGDVYSASFAAVPYVVKALASAPSKADHSYFQFPAWIEICRGKKQIRIPDDLRSAYVDALGQLPKLVAAASINPWQPDFLQCALAAIAAARDSPLSLRQPSNSRPRSPKNSWNGSLQDDRYRIGKRRNVRGRSVCFRRNNDREGSTTACTKSPRVREPEARRGGIRGGILLFQATPRGFFSLT